MSLFYYDDIIVIIDNARLQLYESNLIRIFLFSNLYSMCRYSRILRINIVGRQQNNSTENSGDFTNSQQMGTREFDEKP